MNERMIATVNSVRRSCFPDTGESPMPWSRMVFAMRGTRGSIALRKAMGLSRALMVADWTGCDNEDSVVLRGLEGTRGGLVLNQMR